MTPGYVGFGNRSRGIGFFCRDYLHGVTHQTSNGNLNSITWIKVNTTPALLLCCAYGPPGV